MMMRDKARASSGNSIDNPGRIRTSAFIPKKKAPITEDCALGGVRKPHDFHKKSMEKKP